MYAMYRICTCIEDDQKIILNSSIKYKLPKLHLDSSKIKINNARYFPTKIRRHPHVKQSPNVSQQVNRRANYSTIPLPSH